MIAVGFAAAPARWVWADIQSSAPMRFAVILKAPSSAALATIFPLSQSNPSIRIAFGVKPILSAYIPRMSSSLSWGSTESG